LAADGELVLLLLVQRQEQPLALKLVRKRAQVSEPQERPLVPVGVAGVLPLVALRARW
jgi:hypothetical protein